MKNFGGSWKRSALAQRLSRPSSSRAPWLETFKTTIFALILFALTLIVVAFFAGYVPMQQRRSVVIAETHREEEALPRVRS